MATYPVGVSRAFKQSLPNGQELNLIAIQYNNSLVGDEDSGVIPVKLNIDGNIVGLSALCESEDWDLMLGVSPYMNWAPDPQAVGAIITEVGIVQALPPKFDIGSPLVGAPCFNFFQGALPQTKESLFLRFLNNDTTNDTGVIYLYLWMIESSWETIGVEVAQPDWPVWPA